MIILQAIIEILIFILIVVISKNDMIAIAKDTKKLICGEWEDNNNGICDNREERR